MYLEYNPQNDAGTLLNDITGKRRKKKHTTRICGWICNNFRCHELKKHQSAFQKNRTGFVEQQVAVLICYSMRKKEREASGVAIIEAFLCCCIKL